MDNKSLSFLMNEWGNPCKDALLMHAVANLTSQNWPIDPRGAMGVEPIAEASCKLSLALGLPMPYTSETVTLHHRVKDFVQQCYARSKFTPHDLQMEVVRLLWDAYPSNYCESGLGPL